MTVYYKMRQILLQNATAILLQNATEVNYKMGQDFITKCNSFIKKMRVITKGDNFITKCGVYYKLLCLT